jgi:hypothetical protein
LILSAKKSPGFASHEDAVYLHSWIEHLCIPPIRSGIEKIHELAAAHHASRKSSMSMRNFLPLLREYIDGPVKDWLLAHGEEPFTYSEVLANEGTYGTKRVESLRLVRAAEEDWSISLQHPSLAHTASALVTLGYFCCAHKGDSEEVVSIITSRGDNGKISTEVRVVRTKRRGRSTSRSKKKLPPSVEALDLPNNRHCRVCSCLTEQAEELQRVFNAPQEGVWSEKVQALIRDEHTRYHTPGYSDEYCEAHSPERNPANYKKALKRRDLYLWARRLLIDVRYEQGLSPANIHIIRAAAFLIVDQCPGKKLIRSMPSIVQGYLEAETLSRGLPGEASKLYIEIAASFSHANHPSRDFIHGLGTARAGKLFDAARACNAITDRELGLMSSGFIYDPMRTLLMLGGYVIGTFDDEDVMGEM